MKLINKYVIGTHVMFYEIEILHEFVDSVIQASNETESTENIIVDIFFNMSEYFEKIEPSKIDYIRNTFLEEIKFIIVKSHIP